MTSKIKSQVGVFIAGTFIIWYLLRRTQLGSAYARDMWAIPQYFGLAEGLRSAGKYTFKG